MEDFYRASSRAYVVVNWCSFVGATGVVAGFALMKMFRPWAATRLTLGLHAGVSLVGAVRHVAFIFTSHRSESLCPLIGFVAIFAGHLNLFLNMAIAANLQHVYLQERASRMRWKVALYVAPVLAALVLDVTPFGKTALRI